MFNDELTVQIHGRYSVVPIQTPQGWAGQLMERAELEFTEHGEIANVERRIATYYDLDDARCICDMMNKADLDQREYQGGLFRSMN